MPVGLIKIRKLNEPDLFIHPVALNEHLKLGWEEAVEEEISYETPAEVKEKLVEAKPKTKPFVPPKILVDI